MSQRIGKTQLVAMIAEKAGVTKKVAALMLETFLDVVQTSVQKGDVVSIQGFGTFMKSHRQARRGVNPKTGEPLHIKATDVPKFKAGSEFKAMVK